MIISFAGHASITSKDKVKELVKEQIRLNVINAESVTCYLGGYGDFDELCAVACNELKREKIGIEVVYVTPYVHLPQSRIKGMQTEGLYDASVYPPLEKVPPKFAISKRNEWMVTEADLIIAYVSHGWGGAYKSLEFAKRKKKSIVNIYELL